MLRRQSCRRNTLHIRPFISGYRRDETVAKALEAGAADDLVKPFSPTEPVARVRAALRRREQPEPFVVGELAIDYGHRRVTVGGEAVDLTATEYELLRVLSLDAGRVVTFETSCATSSGTCGASSAKARPAPAYLLNERGVGCRMAKPPNR